MWTETFYFVLSMLPFIMAFVVFCHDKDLPMEKWERRKVSRNKWWEGR